MDALMENPELAASLGIGVMPMLQFKLDRESWPDSTEKMMDLILENAKSQLAESGGVHPVFIAYHMAAGEMYQNVMVTGPYMKNDRTKEVMADTIKSLCQEFDVFATFFVSEAWTVQAPEVASETFEDDIMNHPEVRKTGSLGDHPDRKEVFMINVETSAGAQHHSWDILRDGDTATLGEHVTHNLLEGRFVGFMKASPF